MQEREELTVKKVLELEKRLEMSEYECHKKVWASKIAEVKGEINTTLVFDDGRALKVPYSYVQKHNPKAGGYYVVYGDGCASFIPAGPFEAGYTKIED